MIMSTGANASATSKFGPKRSLLRFERLPARYIHPARLRECLPPNLPGKVQDRLLRDKRLQPRLSAALVKRFDLKACAADDLKTPEGRFALLEGAALGVAVRRIGAIWHARSIAAIILADSLKELIAWLGRDGHRAVLRHVKLACIGVDRDIVGDKPKIDLLCELIERDGRHCIEAWCGQQQDCLAKRLLLKLPPIAAVDDRAHERFREQGVLIADRVMRELVADDGKDGR